MDIKDVEICFGDEDPYKVQRVFDEPAEFTFPSQRYGSTAPQGFAQSEPMYWERCKGHHEDKSRIATLDVRHYLPEEIKLKVEGSKILVEGKHYSERDFGFDSSEFRRIYDLPQNCTAEKVSSRISRDGVLTIEALDQSAPRQDRAKNFCAAERELSDDKNFVVILDVSSFAPEEVSVDVVGNGLHVSAKHESRTDGHYSSEQFDRRFVLPSDVDANTVTSKWSNEGELHIRAERRIPRVNKESGIHVTKKEYSEI